MGTSLHELTFFRVPQTSLPRQGGSWFDLILYVGLEAEWEEYPHL